MRIIVALVLGIGLIACETKEHADAELDAINKAKTAARKASARANTSESQEIGIPECDAYIRSYESCLAEKVPDTRRDALRTTLNEQRNKWQTAVTSGEERAGIAEQCKSAVASAAQAMGDYGCSF